MPGRHSRRSVLAALAALSLPGVSACTGSSDSSGGRQPHHTGKNAGKNTGKRTTRITFWSALRGSQEVVAEFNRTHDHIQVDFQQVPSGALGGYAKLSNAARAGNAPDVATIEYPQVPGFAIDGVARDITDLVDDGLRDKLLPQALELTTFDRRVFSVPLDIEPMVLHYRADLFRKYDIDVPGTWDEFEEAARLVRKRAPDRRLTLFPTDGMTQFAAFSWQAGARWFDTSKGAWNVSMADAPTRRVARYWQRLADQDLVARFATDGNRYPAEIGQGRILSRVHGAWDAGAQMNAHPGQAGKWAIAPFPQWDTRRPVNATHGGSTFAITKDCRRPEAAMEFISWQVTHPDALRARLSSGTSSQFPAAPGLIEVGRKAFDRRYYSGQDIYALFREQAELIDDRWTWGPRMTATQKVMQDGFARAAGGQGTIIDAVREAQRGTLPDLKALGLSTTERSS
ncbi:sugar ABC transporter substrate-binding protein [Streptomyces sp. NPDC000151]|uniref:ABC transporter substrate-binding protein n=1 Tax=Streptomyces sp. NPDC000151 TaxID=3154244 RepID=UPI00331F0B19